MPDPMPGNVDDNVKLIQEAKQQVNQEAQRVVADPSIKNGLAAVAISELNARESQAEEVKVATLLNQGTVPDAKRTEARLVETDVIKTIARVEQKIIIPPGTSARLFEEIIDKKIVDKLTLATAPSVYKLIQKAINQPITVEDLKESFSDLKKLKIDVYNSVLFNTWKDTLKATAIKLGMDPQEAKKEFGERGGARSSSETNNDDIKRKIEELARNFDAKSAELERYINSVFSSIERKVRPDIERRVREKHQGENIQEADIQREVNIELESETRSIKGALLSIFNIHLTQPDAQNRLFDYYQNLANLQRRGLLTVEEVNRLQALGNEWLSFASQRVATKGSLEQRAEQYGVEITSKVGQSILKALSSAEELKALLERAEYQKEGSPGEIDFMKFYRDVRLLCEEILSVTEVHRKEFFQNAFNIFRSGAVYDILVESARNRAIELSQKYPEFASQKVEYAQIELGSDEKQKIERGEKQVPDVKIYRKSLHEVLDAVLVTKMGRLLDVHKFVHDGNKIVEEGMGFETLAKYAEGVDPNDIDQILYEDPDLTMAYQAYMEGLRKDGYLYNRILWSDFGKKDEFGLDRAARVAYRRLRVRKGEEYPDIATGRGEWVLSQFRRKASFAAAMAKLYMGDYWGFLRGVYLPMTLEKQKDGSYKFVTTYPSGGEAGPEKMHTETDLEKTWVRFNVPGFQPNLPYLFQRRKLDTYEPWDHTKVYWVRKEKEDAYMRGATDEYLDFVKNNKTLGEEIRLKVTGTIIRGGWRMEAYKNFIRYKEDGKSDKYQFYETLAQLMTVGSAPLRNFLDNMEYDRIDKETFREMLGEKSLKLGKDDLMTAFKRKCYEEFLFGAVFEKNPTRVLSLERRELTPRGENTVIEDLWDMLKKEFKGKLSDKEIERKLTPLFIEALEMVQQEKGERNKAEFLQAATGATDVEQFRKLLKKRALIPEDLQEEKMKGMLKEYLKLYKEDFGQDLEGKINLDFLTEEKFLETLPKFFQELKKSIYKPRKEGVKKGDPITLAKRYNSWIELGLDVVEDFGGDDMDYTRFFFQGGGKRMVARYISETFVVAGAYAKNLRKFYEDGSAAIAKNQFHSADEFIKFVSEHIAPGLVEMRKGMDNISWGDWGNQFAVRHAIFFDRLVSKDHQYRMLGLGGLKYNIDRQLTKREASLTQDHFRNFIDRPTTSLDADYSEALTRTLLNAAEVPWEAENIPGSGYKEVSFLGRKMVPDIKYEFKEEEKQIGPFKFKFKKPLYDERKIKIGPFTWTMKYPRLKKESRHDWHAGQVKLSEGHVAQIKLIDRYLPIALLVLLLIMLNLGWAASKKNSEKR